MVRVVDFDTEIPGKRRAAFVIFYALDGRPWEEYGDKMDDVVIPRCLMLNRSLGDIGFVGGKVEEGESLRQAAVREVEEEIGYMIEEEKLEPVVAHDIGKITTHAFCVEVGSETLEHIAEQAMGGEHFGSEISGVFLAHLIDYLKVFDKRGGLAGVLKNYFAPSVREELVHFLLKKHIVSKGELAGLCERSGYDLEELLK